MIAKTTDDKNIYYEVIGNLAANETIIFLNGLSQSTAAWGLITPYFEKKYKIILMDFIFQGQSDTDSPVRDFDTHARDVLSILDILGINEVILCGLSYGSLVGQNFAVNYPDRIKKLILISSFAHKHLIMKRLNYLGKMRLHLAGIL